ncbi:hypothetical protein [Acidisoma sp. 7E03]
MIPYSALLAMLPQVENGRLSIPVSLLQFLLSIAASCTDFDEEEYLRRNPDVAVAVRQGKVASGRDHFLRSGYFEGRAGVSEVSETWYFRNNPDVARAVKAGEWESAAEHYTLRGVFEWRAPSGAVADDVARWRAAVGGASPAVVTTSAKDRPTTAP